MRGGSDHFAPDGERAEGVVRALQVLLLDKKIAAWLAENDPKALEQAEAALGWQRETCPVCGNRVSRKDEMSLAPHQRPDNGALCEQHIPANHYRGIACPPCPVVPAGPTFESPDSTTWRTYRGVDGKSYLCGLTHNGTVPFSIRWFVGEEG